MPVRFRNAREQSHSTMRRPGATPTLASQRQSNYVTDNNNHNARRSGAVEKRHADRHIAGASP
jgi:hypothetical protein